MIFHDDGRPVHAKELLAAIASEGELAKKYVAVATEAAVCSLRKHA